MINHCYSNNFKPSLTQTKYVNRQSFSASLWPFDLVSPKSLKTHLKDEWEGELSVCAATAVLVQLLEECEQLRGEAGGGQAGGQTSGRGRGALSARRGRGLARARGGGLKILTLFILILHKTFIPRSLTSSVTSAPPSSVSFLWKWSAPCWFFSCEF